MGTRNSLSRLINGHNGISAETALRLSKAFGGSAESWLQQQLNYDLAQVLKREDPFKIKRIKAASSTSQGNTFTESFCG